MRISLAKDADEFVRHVSNGRLFLEPDGATVYLVDALTGEKAPLLCIEPTPPPTSTSPPTDDRAPIQNLSQRELQLFKAIGEGTDMPVVAAQMGVSLKTVETYRARIKQKLDVKNRTKLVALAVEWTLRGRPGYVESLSEPSHNGNGHVDGSFHFSPDGRP